MKTFLSLKHWQLFFLFIGPSILFHILTLVSHFLGNNVNAYIIAFPAIMIIFIVILFGWLYAIGTNLHKMIPTSVHLNLKRFKIFLAIPFVYMVIITIIMILISTRHFDEVEPSIPIFAGIMPLHFFSMFCIFYCLYFVAKVIKTVERQQEVTFSDFAGEFFLIWFYPIGIWFIQPKINKLFHESNLT